MHPLQANLTTLSDNELEDKIKELTKKYFAAVRVSPTVSTQILMLLEDYKHEQQLREFKKNENSKSELGEDFDGLINIG